MRRDKPEFVTKMGGLDGASPVFKALRVALSREQIRELVEIQVAKAFPKRTIIESASSVSKDDGWTPQSEAKLSVKRAAQNLVPKSLPVPTEAQCNRHGGGLPGYLKAARAIERGEL